MELSKVDKVYRLFGYLKKLCIVISGLAIAVMIILITLDVTSRNILQSGIPGSYEIVESILMPTVIFWAILITYASGSIPRLDMLTNKFSEKMQFSVGIVLILIDIFIYGLMTIYSWSRAAIALKTGIAISAGGTLISISPIFLFVPIGFLFVTIEAIFILTKMIMNKKFYYHIDTENEPMQE